MKQPVLYKITNVVNGKFYVGSTGNVRERFRQHRNKLRRGVHHCAHLQAAWNKYGEDCFKFSIIEHIASMEALVEAENKWLIDHVGKENCYNAGTRADAPMRGRSGAAHPNFGKPQTPEHKAQISATLKQFYAEDYFNHPRVGKTHSEETKAKISASKKANPVAYWQGKERSEETKAKISEAQKGVAKPGRKYTEAGLAKVRANIEAGRSHKHWVGRKHTEESKIKMSKAVFVMPDGLMFPSLTAVLEKYQIKMPTLRRALLSGAPITKGKLKGYSFQYGGVAPQFTLTDKLLAFPPHS